MLEEPQPLSANAIAIKLAIVFALVLANAFFVASEFALISVRKTRIDQLAAEGNSSAQVVQRALRDINRYIAATQVGITLAALMLGSMGEQTLTPLFERALKGLPPGLLGGARAAIAVGLAYFMMTVFTVIIGELLPKSLTLQKSENVALVVVRPMSLFVKLTSPLVWLLNGIGGFLLARFGLSAGEQVAVHSPEELDLLFTQAHEGGQLTQTERDLLHRVVKFSDLTAREVMVPRVEMQAIPVEMSRQQFFEFLNGVESTPRAGSAASSNGQGSAPHTRTPVYRDSLDEIVGIAHLKDLVRFAGELREEKNTAGINLMKVAREVTRVPETITIDRLLSEFQKSRQQIAIVMDEYGGTAGMVTMGDLLSQVFGDVHDEFDQHEPEIVEFAPNSVEVAGRVLIDDVNERFGTGFNSDDADTMAGLVLNKLGRPAQLGDEVEINAVKLKVLDLDRLRITRLRLDLDAAAAREQASVANNISSAS
jgi:CBS domain containing-hemolysin-like protein